MDDVEQLIVNYLSSRDLSESSEPLTATSALMQRGLLDSLELMSLVHHLEETFGVRVPPDEYLPETFETPQSIANMVKRLRTDNK